MYRRLSLIVFSLLVTFVVASPLAKHNHHLKQRNINNQLPVTTVVVYVTQTATPSVAPVHDATSPNVVPTPGSHLHPGTTKSNPSPTHSSSSSLASSAPSSLLDSAIAALAGALLDPFVPPNVPFPDGKIPCSSFPGDQQGVLKADWLNMDGWTGLQNPGGLNPSSCSEGVYCSYACQPGMLKTQWPSNQPASGATTGGLLCKNGFLTLTSPERSNFLCEWGTNTVYVVNNLTEPVTFCATDYPGSENMVRPVYIAPGEMQPLSVPDQSTYFRWNGKPTSTQYYVNNAGVGITDGCVWGTPNGNVGNWASLNVGAGTADGITYVSLIANPLTSAKINFNAKIAPSPGSTMNGDCSITGGTFGGNTNGNSGCTASLTSGKAYIHLTN